MTAKAQSPKIGCGVYIFNEKGEILLGLRKNSHGEGSWCPPGGHLEFGETPEECVAREAKEEAGVEIKNIAAIGFTNDFFIPQNKHYITLSLKASLKSGTPKVKEPDKCSEWRWFKWEDFPEPLFLPVVNLRKRLTMLEP